MIKTPEINPTQIAKILGKRGGDKTKEKMGKDHFKKIGSAGAKKRWSKEKPKNKGKN